MGIETGQSTRSESIPSLYAGARQPGMAQRVAGAGIWAIAGQGIRLAVSLAVIPYLLRKLGTSEYGLLTLINVVIACVSFNDLGMGIASTKFATEALAKKNERSEADAIWTSLLICFFPLLLSSFFLFIAAGPISKYVARLPAAQQYPATIALRLGILTIWAVVAGSILNTPQLARLRQKLNSCIELGAALLQFCLIFIFLWRGGGLISIIAAGALSAIFAAVVHLVASGRLCPSLWKPKIDRELIKPLFKFGLGAMAVVILGTVVGQGEKLLLVRWGSTVSLAYYNIAMTIAGLLVISLSALSQPLLPSFVHLMSTGQRERLERLYNNILTGVLVVLMPVALVICISAKPFLGFWAGADFGKESVLPLYILIVGNALKALSMLPGSLAVAAGRIDLLPKFQAVELLPYGLLIFLLMARWGIAGAAIAWSIRAFAECFYLFHSAERIAGIQQRVSFNKNGSFLLCLLVLFPIPIASKILDLHFSVTMLITCFSIASYSFLIYLRVAGAEQRSWINEFCKSFFR